MKIKAAIVDDHLLFLKSISLMLESFREYEVVIEALNGKELQQKMAAAPHLPEIMLIDVNMPVMNGVETAAWVSENYPTIKMIALSQNDSEKAIIEMIKSGCSAYMLKDTHPDELEKALQEVIKTGYYNSDQSNINFRRLLKYEEEQIKITEREKIFLKYVCTEMTYKEVAALMHVSERTIDGYRDNLFQKMKVQSRVGLALEAIRRQIVNL
ncbi:MAG: response regulator transcription factor [Bacteroidetes bacterium]|nr:response regulator transcription factor [Bacteroidota bacterium]